MIKKKPAKAVIIIGCIAILILAGAGVAAGFGFYLTSTKAHCGDYSREKSQTADSPDRAVAEMYDQCLREKGLSGF